jgi:chaperone modulatory protein CbpM
MTSTHLERPERFVEISLTVEELASASQTDPDWVVRHVMHDCLGAQAGEPEGWRFGSDQLRRARLIASIERMFETNCEAAAFVADLIEEIQRLKRG